jgi:hypothetical protein
VKGKLECGWIFRRGLRVHQLAHELDYRVNAAFAFTRIFYASDFSKRAAGYAHIRYIPPNPQASQQILEKELAKENSCYGPASLVLACSQQ